MNALRNLENLLGQLQRRGDRTNQWCRLEWATNIYKVNDACDTFEQGRRDYTNGRIPEVSSVVVVMLSLHTL
jgi:hypothetical protein